MDDHGMAEPPKGPELGEIYAESRRRISDLVGSCSGAELARRLPTCPDWTVRDVIGHLAGLIADVRASRLDGLATPAWTQAQVDRFAHRSLPEVLDDWAQAAGPAEADWDAVTAPAGAASVRIVSDAYSHEHDIRGSLGQPGWRESRAFAVTLPLQLDGLRARLSEAGLPALEMRCADGRRFTVGDGEAGARVEVGSTWELLRALTARRSRSQVAAYAWDGAGSEKYLDCFFRFAPPVHDILE
jgi:uncharacterized protein (TIGR03083 family)